MSMDNGAVWNTVVLAVFPIPSRNHPVLPGRHHITPCGYATDHISLQQQSYQHEYIQPEETIRSILA